MCHEVYTLMRKFLQVTKVAFKSAGGHQGKIKNIALKKGKATVSCIGTEATIFLLLHIKTFHMHMHNSSLIMFTQVGFM